MEAEEMISGGRIGELWVGSEGDALHLSVNIAAAAALLRQGVSPELAGNDGMTPRYAIAEKSTLEQMKLYLD